MFGNIEASKINDVKLHNTVLNIPCKMKGIIETYAVNDGVESCYVCIIPQGFNILFK